MEMGAKLLNCITEEAKLKHFCATGQHHEREREREEEEEAAAGEAAGLQRAAGVTGVLRCPPAALPRCASSIPSGFCQLGDGGAGPRGRGLHRREGG